jgi:hypothetical protein
MGCLIYLCPCSPEHVLHISCYGRPRAPSGVRRRCRQEDTSIACDCQCSSGANGPEMAGRGPSVMVPPLSLPRSQRERTAWNRLDPSVRLRKGSSDSMSTSRAASITTVVSHTPTGPDNSQRGITNTGARRLTTDKRDIVCTTTCHSDHPTFEDHSTAPMCSLPCCVLVRWT